MISSTNLEGVGEGVEDHVSRKETLLVCRPLHLFQYGSCEELYEGEMSGSQSDFSTAA